MNAINTNNVSIEQDDAARLAGQVIRTSQELATKATTTMRRDSEVATAMFERAQDMLKLAAFVAQRKLRYAANFYAKLPDDVQSDVPQRVRNLMHKVRFAADAPKSSRSDDAVTSRQQENVN